MTDASAGVEIWVFEAPDEGEGEILLACACLGEEGAERSNQHIFVERHGMA